MTGPRSLLMGRVRSPSWESPNKRLAGGSPACPPRQQRAAAPQRACPGRRAGVGGRRWTRWRRPKRRHTTMRRRAKAWWARRSLYRADSRSALERVGTLLSGSHLTTPDGAVPRAFFLTSPQPRTISRKMRTTLSAPRQTAATASGSIQKSSDGSRVAVFVVVGTREMAERGFWRVRGVVVPCL